MAHSQETPVQLHAALGVRSKVQELTGRLQSCLVQLQMLADNASACAQQPGRLINATEEADLHVTSLGSSALGSANSEKTGAHVAMQPAYVQDVGLPGFSRPGRSWRTSTSFTTTREPDQHTLQLHDSSAAPLPQAPATQHDNSPSPYRMEAWRSLTVPGLVTELHQQVCTAGTESCGLSISQCDDTAGHDNYVADTMPEDDTGVPSQTGASRYSMETSATAAFAAQDAAAQELGRAASLTINPVQEVEPRASMSRPAALEDGASQPGVAGSAGKQEGVHSTTSSLASPLPASQEALMQWLLVGTPSDGGVLHAAQTQPVACKVVSSSCSSVSEDEQEAWSPGSDIRRPLTCGGGPQPLAQADPASRGQVPAPDALPHIIAGSRNTRSQRTTSGHSSAQMAARFSASAWGGRNGDNVGGCGQQGPVPHSSSRHSSAGGSQCDDEACQSAAHMQLTPSDPTPAQQATAELYLPGAPELQALSSAVLGMSQAPKINDLVDSASQAGEVTSVMHQPAEVVDLSPLECDSTLVQGGCVRQVRSTSTSGLAASSDAATQVDSPPAHLTTSTTQLGAASPVTAESSPSMDPPQPGKVQDSAPPPPTLAPPATSQPSSHSPEVLPPPLPPASGPPQGGALRSTGGQEVRSPSSAKVSVGRTARDFFLPASHGPDSSNIGLPASMQLASDFFKGRCSTSGQAAPQPAASTSCSLARAVVEVDAEPQAEPPSLTAGSVGCSPEESVLDTLALLTLDPQPDTEQPQHQEQEEEGHSQLPHDTQLYIESPRWRRVSGLSAAGSAPGSSHATGSPAGAAGTHAAVVHAHAAPYAHLDAETTPPGCDEGLAACEPPPDPSSHPAEGHPWHCSAEPAEAAHRFTGITAGVTGSGVQVAGEEGGADAGGGVETDQDQATQQMAQVAVLLSLLQSMLGAPLPDPQQVASIPALVEAPAPQSPAASAPHSPASQAESSPLLPASPTAAAAPPAVQQGRCTAESVAGSDSLSPLLRAVPRATRHSLVSCTTSASTSPRGPCYAPSEVSSLDVPSFDPHNTAGIQYTHELCEGDMQQQQQGLSDDDTPPCDPDSMQQHYTRDLWEERSVDLIMHHYTRRHTRDSEAAQSEAGASSPSWALADPTHGESATLALEQADQAAAMQPYSDLAQFLAYSSGLLPAPEVRSPDGEGQLERSVVGGGVTRALLMHQQLMHQQQLEAGQDVEPLCLGSEDSVPVDIVMHTATAAAIEPEDAFPGLARSSSHHSSPALVDSGLVRHSTWEAVDDASWDEIEPQSGAHGEWTQGEAPSPAPIWSPPAAPAPADTQWRAIGQHEGEACAVALSSPVADPNYQHQVEGSPGSSRRRTTSEAIRDASCEINVLHGVLTSLAKRGPDSAAPHSSAPATPDPAPAGASHHPPHTTSEGGAVLAHTLGAHHHHHHQHVSPGRHLKALIAERSSELPVHLSDLVQRVVRAVTEPSQRSAAAALAEVEGLVGSTAGPSTTTTSLTHVAAPAMGGDDIMYSESGRRAPAPVAPSTTSLRAPSSLYEELQLIIADTSPSALEAYRQQPRSLLSTQGGGEPAAAAAGGGERQGPWQRSPPQGDGDLAEALHACTAISRLRHALGPVAGAGGSGGGSSCMLSGSLGLVTGGSSLAGSVAAALQATDISPREAPWVLLLGGESAREQALGRAMHLVRELRDRHLLRGTFKLWRQAAAGASNTSHHGCRRGAQQPHASKQPASRPASTSSQPRTPVASSIPAPASAVQAVPASPPKVKKGIAGAHRSTAAGGGAVSRSSRELHSGSQVKPWRLPASDGGVEVPRKPSTSSSSSSSLPEAAAAAAEPVSASKMQAGGKLQQGMLRRQARGSEGPAVHTPSRAAAPRRPSSHASQQSYDAVRAAEGEVHSDAHVPDTLRHVQCSVVAAKPTSQSIMSKMCGTTAAAAGTHTFPAHTHVSPTDASHAFQQAGMPSADLGRRPRQLGSALDERELMSSPRSPGAMDPACHPMFC